MPSDAEESDSEVALSNPADWPPSNLFVLAAVLLLVATALALVVSTEDGANRFATYAYYALVVGVALRLAEHALDGRVRVTLGTVWARFAARLPAVAVPESADSGSLRELLWLALAGLLVGGGIPVVVWWRDPVLQVAPGYLFGWLAAVTFVLVATLILQRKIEE